ncbi:MAG: YidC/Oxa1 family membrane protein insertase [Eubacteriales bacterium]|nr:YidC/Oxa1 family membrane protein insertase [Eubacteriales bacterium]
MLLTKNTTFIIGPVAEVIGYVMNFIFKILSGIGLPNLGLSIIIMTILIYMCMLPLTIRQQKFSKLQRKMQPELNKINKKYQGRNDNDAVMAKQEEIKQVYEKYGVSATGSCVQLLIQMPILFALYRVFYNIPAYLPLVKDAFFPLVDKLYDLDPAGKILLSQDENQKYIFSGVTQFAKRFTSDSFVNGDVTFIKNTFIDILNKFQSADWTKLAEKASSLGDNIASTTAKLNQYNNFLGLNIAESPSTIMRRGGIMIVIALIIPFLAAFTQWLNVKLMPQASSNDPNDQSAQTMKTMNLMMPMMSAVFCFSLPSGMGLYWIVGAVVRIVQQIFINKHIDKMDIDEMIEKNKEKAKAKAEKRREKAGDSSSSSTKSYSGPVRRRDRLVTKLSQAQENEIEKINQSRKQKKFKEGSLSEKADLVRQFNEYGRKFPGKPELITEQEPEAEQE